MASNDVAHEILEIAGISHHGLVDDVVEALSVTPDWIPRDHKSTSRIEQLTYRWEAFKHLVKHSRQCPISVSTTPQCGRRLVPPAFSAREWRHRRARLLSGFMRPTLVHHPPKGRPQIG